MKKFFDIFLYSLESSFELHKDTQEKITDMSNKLIASHKTSEEIDKELKKVINLKKGLTYILSTQPQILYLNR